MKPNQRVGGNLEQALNTSAPPIKPLEIIQEAFIVTARSIVPLLLALISLIALTVCCLLIAYTLIGENALQPGTQSYNAILLVMQLLILPPLTAALYWMGVQHSIGRKTSHLDLFRFVRQPAPFIAIAFVIALVQLLVAALPPVISMPVIVVVQIFTSMALVLAAEYRLPPLQALRASVIAVARRAVSIGIIGLIMLLFGVISILTYGLGFIWTLPMVFNVIGILYREIYGIEVEQQGNEHNDQPTTNDSDSWQA